MPTIKLEVVSPDAVVYQADIHMLVVKAEDGEIGVMPNHLPMIASIIPCAMRVKYEDGREELIACGGGFMEVLNNKITVLASCAETPIQIDVLRAEKAYQRAEERIKAFNSAPLKHTDIDLSRAEAALQRAIVRLKVAKSVGA